MSASNAASGATPQAGLRMEARSICSGSHGCVLLPRSLWSCHGDHADDECDGDNADNDDDAGDDDYDTAEEDDGGDEAGENESQHGEIGGTKRAKTG